MTTKGADRSASKGKDKASGDTAELLFEIGVEEIPASFVTHGIKELGSRLREALAAERLTDSEAGADNSQIKVMGTPRRLAVSVAGLPLHQPDLQEEVSGPPAKIAFDESGTPTKAAMGFAKKNGVEMTDLRRGAVEGKKGEYVLATRFQKGNPTTSVLTSLLSDICGQLAWPKSMRWGQGDAAFARPVHWLVAIFNGEVIPVEFAGIKADRKTVGHRFLHSGLIELDGTKSQYESALGEAYVLVCPVARQERVEEEIARVEKKEGVKVRPDSELVAEVCNLIEFPVAVCGSFDEGFLTVPDRAIVSAMRSHQRYFATERKDGSLDNRFVTIAGTKSEKPEVVREGNERVLAARLSDAKFFFDEDQKQGLDKRAAGLGDVVFQAKLGTLADKSKRIADIALWMSSVLSANTKDLPSKEQIVRAAALCKADLITQMVYEFPDLQGVMGHRYALANGENPAVAIAIEEHYLPRGASDSLPTSSLGAMLAVADRVDTLLGCFAAGLIPSGSADPYGLRRATLGILQILLDRNWRQVSLENLLAATKKSYGSALPISDKTIETTMQFLRTRLKGLLEGRELAADCVEAALSSGYYDVPDACARAEAVSELRKRPDFDPLAAAFKRVANILKGKDAKLTESKAPDPSAFIDPNETALWSAYSKIEERARDHLAKGEYHSALTVLAELKEPVDQFFETVLVMDKDEAVRTNRLALLQRINSTFAQVADFRQLAV